jgi:hypothetical protein
MVTPPQHADFLWLSSVCRSEGLHGSRKFSPSGRAAPHPPGWPAPRDSGALGIEDEDDVTDEIMGEICDIEDEMAELADTGDINALAAWCVGRLSVGAENEREVPAAVGEDEDEDDASNPGL